MNTERPENDDAEARADGSVRDTGGASGSKEPASAGGEAAHGEPAGTEAAKDRPAETKAAETEAARGEPAETETARGRPEETGAAARQEPAAAEAARSTSEETGAAAQKEPAETGAERSASAEPGGSGAEEAVRESGAGGPEAPRRPRTPVLIATVAAAVLLIGGGGAYLATSLAGGSGDTTAPGANGEPTPPPLTLDGYSEGGTPGIAPGEPNPYGATYRAEGALPDGPESAPVYRTRGQVTQAQVTELAEALGVEGKPVAEGEVWRIGGKDGSGPTLRVDRAAPGAWSFSRYAPGTDNCKPGKMCQAPPSDASPVSVEAAGRAAAPVLKAVGQDDAKLDASQVMGANRVVNAEPEIGGLPTYGWTTGVIVGAGGEIVGGNGRLAEPVKGDTYPVVGADKALELMNAAPGSRGGIGGCATPVPLDEEPQREPCVEPSDGSGTKGGNGPGKDTLTVESAVFGLAAHSVDGRQGLVPSWLFEVRAPGAKDTLTVTHPAVDPKYLEQPSAEPSGPGDEPTSAPSTRGVEVEGYTAEGDELTVTFTGGVCADYTAKATESGDRVTVTVTETPWPDKVCILIAKQYQLTVRLEKPLGDRQVVGADGEPVPLHKDGPRLPAPPSQTR